MELVYTLAVYGQIQYGSAREELAAYAQPSEAPERKPNIIVIMDEAFSDPAVLADFQTNEDYMPFMHSMMAGADNTVSGWLNVSVLGGNTANTEFEYLTGNTMAFLPTGSIPYQQYIKAETPSMASHLASLGYKTVAMHPYKATGWDRDKVYPDLGFQEMHFLPDYKNPLLVVIGFLVLLILEFFCRYTLKKGTWKFRIPTAAVVCALLVAFGGMFHSDEIVQQKLRLYDKLFTPTTINAVPYSQPLQLPTYHTSF